MTDQVFDRMVAYESWADWCGENLTTGDAGMTCRCCGGWGASTEEIVHAEFCGIPAALQRFELFNGADAAVARMLAFIFGEAVDCFTEDARAGIKELDRLGFVVVTKQGLQSKRGDAIAKAKGE